MGPEVLLGSDQTDDWSQDVPIPLTACLSKQAQLTSSPRLPQARASPNHRKATPKRYSRTARGGIQKHSWPYNKVASGSLLLWGRSLQMLWSISLSQHNGETPLQKSNVGRSNFPPSCYLLFQNLAFYCFLLLFNQEHLKPDFKTDAVCCSFQSIYITAEIYETLQKSSEMHETEIDETLQKSTGIPFVWCFAPIYSCALVKHYTETA